MTTVKTTYLGNLRTENIHLQSGCKSLPMHRLTTGAKEKLSHQPICWLPRWAIAL